MSEYDRLKKQKDEMLARSPDRKEIKRLRELINEANSLLRSAHSIVGREGKTTNWIAYGKRLNKALIHQHEYMYPEMYPEIALNGMTYEEITDD